MTQVQNAVSEVDRHGGILRLLLLKSSAVCFSVDELLVQS